VGNEAEALEHAAKSGDFAYVNDNNTGFIAKSESLIESIEKLLAGIDSKTSKPRKSSPDKELLSRLVAACEAYDMDAVDEVIAEINAFEYEADDGLAAWLTENVDKMNFAEIIEKLSE
jgi:hypothetical protein